MSDDAAKMEREKNIPLVDLRNGARGILTWAQTDGPVLADAALELIGEARRIAEKLDPDSRTVSTIIIGKNVKQYAETLIHYGADRVLVVEDDRLTDFLTEPYVTAIIEAIKRVNPEIMLFSASTQGRDMAPRIAGTLNLGLSADCTAFDVGYYSNRRKNQRFNKVFKMIRPSFGESKLATIIGPWTYPQCATARPGTFRKLKPDKSRKGEIIEFTPEWKPTDFQVELIETVRKPDNVDLSKADIIVAGGFGMGGPEGFKLLRELIDAIRKNGQNAELGASRGAVDAGFIPYEYQVGQTGKTVRPSVYIAVGISGAIQHLQGMKDSEIVIAINNDPNANIFKNADFGLVMDYQEAIPLLIEKVKSGYLFPTK